MFFTRTRTIATNLQAQGYKFDDIWPHFFSRRITIYRGAQAVTCDLKLKRLDGEVIVWQLSEKRTRGMGVFQRTDSHWISPQDLDQRMQV